MRDTSGRRSAGLDLDESLSTLCRRTDAEKGLAKKAAFSGRSSRRGSFRPDMMTMAISDICPSTARASDSPSIVELREIGGSGSLLLDGEEGPELVFTSGGLTEETGP